MNAQNSLLTEKAWEQFSKKLRQFIVKKVKNESIAEDLLQDVFLKIQSSKTPIQDEEHFIRWIFKIAYNLIIEHLRSEKIEVSIPLEMANESNFSKNSEDFQFLNNMVGDWIRSTIQNLPEPYSEAVKLYELDNLSQQEIASQLNISLSGAKSRIQRGRKKVKEMLEDCCSFERDRRGNILGYKKNSAQACQGKGPCQG